MIIKKVPASETWSLRHRVLRPQQPLESVRYPEDALADARHFAIYQDGQITAIGSVYHEAEPEVSEFGVWRLRGMATAPEVRRTGLGRKLLAYLLADLKADNATRVWCNARAGVSGFYIHCGFQIESDVFDMQGIGPHVVMKYHFPGRGIP